MMTLCVIKSWKEKETLLNELLARKGFTPQNFLKKYLNLFLSLIYKKNMRMLKPF